MDRHSGWIIGQESQDLWTLDSTVTPALGSGTSLWLTDTPGYYKEGTAGVPGTQGVWLELDSDITIGAQAILVEGSFICDTEDAAITAVSACGLRPIAVGYATYDEASSFWGRPAELDADILDAAVDAAFWGNKLACIGEDSTGRVNSNTIFNNGGTNISSNAYLNVNQDAAEGSVARWKYVIAGIPGGNTVSTYTQQVPPLPGISKIFTAICFTLTCTGTGTPTLSGRVVARPMFWQVQAH